MKLATRATCVALLLAGTVLPPATGFPEAAPADTRSLARQLSSFLEAGADRSRLRENDSIAPLGRYPLTATMTYLLMQDDPNTLRRHYPVLLREVNALFAPDNLTEGGLVRGLPGPASRASLSPAVNVFANLELWSLHLIAWKIAAYEDALDYLAWSKRFSETVTRSFYSASRGEFFPITSSGLFGAGGTPGELLPLVLDRTLGSTARARLLDTAAERFDAAAPPLTGAPGSEWGDPAARPVILDLLKNCPDCGKGAIGVDLSRIAAHDTTESSGNPWIEFWRSNRVSAEGLLPTWAPLSAFANVTLLLERESLALDSEIAAFRAGIDTIDAALAHRHTIARDADVMAAIDFHAASVATINRLMGRIERFSGFISGPKERWRVADESKWIRVSPRIKRLVNEGCAAAVKELAAVKTLLSDELDRAVRFALELPVEPLSPGEPVAFKVVLSAWRPISIAQTYLHIGDSRWRVGPPAGSSVISERTPLRYDGSFSLPADAVPGIAPVVAHLDFLASGKRIELWRRESVAVAMPHDASMALPAGRRIEGNPVPITISVRYRTERDTQGEISGSFLRELVTQPVLPARFLVSAGTDPTVLTLTAAPRARLAPGSYPFSLVVSVGGTSIASFADSLVHPFRWICLGPFPSSAPLLSDGVRYQADLFKRHRTEQGTEIGWQEAPGGSVDTEGALRPDRIYESVGAASALFYTMVDSQTRVKIGWSLATADAVALWINGLPVLPAVPAGSGRIGGEAELRQGPNSFLVATRWERSPAAIRFELRDENGLPPAGLNNELAEIIDGYERIIAPPAEANEHIAAPVRMQPVSFSLEEPRAREVSLVGSFNNWDPAATPMKRDETGLWRASLMLRPGRYTYKFVVDRTRKIVDPRNSVSEADGFGGSSSVIEVK